MHLEAARSIQHKRKAAEEQRQKAAAEELQRQKAAEEHQRQKAAEEHERQKAAEEHERQKAAEEHQRQKAAEEQCQKAADEKKEKEEMAKKQKENTSFQQKGKESQDSVRGAGVDNVRRGLFREPSFQEPTSAAQPIQNTIENRIVPTNKSLSQNAILMNLDADSDESSQPMSTHSDSFDITSSPSSNRSSQLSNGILQSEKIIVYLH